MCIPTAFYGRPLSVRPKELVKDTDWRSSEALNAEALVPCATGSVSVNTYVVGGCSPAHSGRALLRKRGHAGKDNVNRRSLRFNVHVVEVRKNVKLPYHRLDHWEPHLHLPLSIWGRPVSHAHPPGHNKDCTGCRCRDAIYTRKTPNMQRVGGTADCHRIIIRREVHWGRKNVSDTRNTT
jgi:hypothetical protein